MGTLFPALLLGFLQIPWDFFLLYTRIEGFLRPPLWFLRSCVFIIGASIPPTRSDSGRPSPLVSIGNPAVSTQRLFLIPPGCLRTLGLFPRYLIEFFRTTDPQCRPPDTCLVFFGQSPDSCLTRPSDNGRSQYRVEGHKLCFYFLSLHPRSWYEWGTLRPTMP